MLLCAVVNNPTGSWNAGLLGMHIDYTTSDAASDGASNTATDAASDFVTDDVSDGASNAKTDAVSDGIDVRRFRLSATPTVRSAHQRLVRQSLSDWSVQRRHWSMLLGREDVSGH
jgi:hypothetical protein